MTNGEKLKEVFPSIELYEKSHDAIQINFDSVWWNAEYKEPTTKNDLGVDLISREDVLMCLTGEFENREYEPSELIKIFSKRIKALSSVTPQPRRGHWKHDRANVRCSNCGKGYKDAFGRTSASTYNYCPNCGSDNREVEE